MPTEKEKKDYFANRWIAEQVVKGKMFVQPTKFEQLKETYPHIMKNFRERVKENKPPPVGE